MNYKPLCGYLKNIQVDQHKKFSINKCSDSRSNRIAKCHKTFSSNMRDCDTLDLNIWKSLLKINISVQMFTRINQYGIRFSVLLMVSVPHLPNLSSTVLYSTDMLCDWYRLKSEWWEQIENLTELSGWE